MALSVEQMRAELEQADAAMQGSPLLGASSAAPAATGMAADLQMAAASQLSGQLSGQPVPIHQAVSLWDSFKAGAEISPTVLFLRGKNPEEVLQADPSRAQKLAYIAGQTLGDLPTLVAGGLLGGMAGAAVGGPAAPLTTVAGVGAGAMGLTEGVRSWLLQQYDIGAQRQDLADKLAATAWAAVKGAAVGAATNVAGGVVLGKLGAAASATTKTAAVTAAELATMVTVSKALEGHIPQPSDFLDGAIMLGGLKFAGITAGKMREVFRTTGQTPKQVVDAALANPKTHDELLDIQYPAIPEEFKSAVQPHLTPRSPELQDFAQYPFPGSMPDDSPLMISARNIDTPEQAQLLFGRMTELFAKDIDEQRRGLVPTRISSNEASVLLKDWVGPKGLTVPEHVIGTAEADAMILARTTALRWLTTDVNEKTILVRQLEWGTPEATEAYAAQLAAMDRLRMAYQYAIGGRAESGRALRAWGAARDLFSVERLAELQKSIEAAGGPEAVAKMAELMDTVRGNTRATIALSRSATNFEKFVAAWRMGMVSGFRTHEINMLSNIAFAATMAPREAIAAMIGALHGGDKVRASDAVGMAIGQAYGAFKGAKLAWNVMTAGLDKRPNISEKADQAPRVTFTSKGGKLAERLTFGALAAEDIWARTSAEYGEAVARAMEIVRKENDAQTALGFPARAWGNSDFYNRVLDYVNNPTAAMKAAMDKAGQRYTFTQRQQGGIAETLLEFTQKHPWFAFVVPFITTPAAILREMARLTPLAPVVQTWREDIAKGGVARDRALAEVALGAAIMVPVFLAARAGHISGAGNPDKQARAADYAAGWRPYSINVGGAWYSYNRLEPVGTLFGMAADVANAWNIMSGPQHDKLAKVLISAAANVATNKTWLKGVAGAIAALGGDEAGAEKELENLAGSLVPGIVHQTAQILDPYMREVNSTLDAVQSRIPFWREGLQQKLDIFGQPIAATGTLQPIMTGQVSTDKVRTEASRLMVGQGKAPQSLPIRFPGRPFDAHVDLTDEQRYAFGKNSGETAYSILDRVVNAPGWDNMNPIAQRAVYQRVFQVSRHKAAMESLPVEQRGAAIGSLMQEYGLQ